MGVCVMTANRQQIPFYWYAFCFTVIGLRFIEVLTNCITGIVFFAVATVPFTRDGAMFSQYALGTGMFVVCGFVLFVWLKQMPRRVQVWQYPTWLRACSVLQSAILIAVATLAILATHDTFTVGQYWLVAVCAGTVMLVNGFKFALNCLMFVPRFRTYSAELWSKVPTVY